MKIPKRIKLLVILIVVLILLVAGIYFFTKKSQAHSAAATQAVSSSTRNYSGNDFNVDYLAKDTLEGVDTKSGMREVSFTDSDPSLKHEYDTLYTVYIKDGISDTQTLATYVKSFINTYNGGSGAAITEKTVTVVGTSGLEFSYNSTARGLKNDPVYTTAVIHDNNAYIIQQVNGNPAGYMQFVSSFSFQ